MRKFFGVSKLEVIFEIRVKCWLLELIIVLFDFLVRVKFLKVIFLLSCKKLILFLKF